MTQTATKAAQTKSVAPAAYGTLLVHAERGLQSSQRVEFAGRLARELGACLIGVGAETFAPVLAAEAPLPYAADARVHSLMQILEDDLSAAEQDFRRDAGGADLEWRKFLEDPARALVRMAHAADLIVMSPRGDKPRIGEADPGAVVVNAGRPVLIVPPHAHRLDTDAVVVAWKDTRETRRAVAAALPFLRAANDVLVVEICDEYFPGAVVEQTQDVVAGLKRQGVKARAELIPSKDGVINGLMRAVSAHGADLIVAGAYGHSRLQELVFGGVTDYLLRKPACCVLMAH
jgi:nucleotide-binding universal stress UspA family protein